MLVQWYWRTLRFSYGFSAFAPEERDYCKVLNKPKHGCHSPFLLVFGCTALYAITHRVQGKSVNSLEQLQANISPKIHNFQLAMSKTGSSEKRNRNGDIRNLELENCTFFQLANWTISHNNTVVLTSVLEKSQFSSEIGFLTAGKIPKRKENMN